MSQSATSHSSAQSGAYVLTLIAPRGALSGDILGQIRAALGSEWLAGEGVELAAAEAHDLDLTRNLDARAARERLAPILSPQRIDFAIQRAEDRRKRLLVADMDSTIITCECLDEIADFAGLKPKIAAITERAMRGEIAFEPALRERVALLAGLPEEVLATVMRERVHLMPGAKALVATMRANGARCVLVSGGFTFFTARVAAACGFDSHFANRLEIAGGALTGGVVEPILGREAKLEALHSERAAIGARITETIAVGDGANDLAMIAEAGLGVAYHAKPVVAEAAPAVIAYGDLTALLYLQGYRRDEFIQT